MGEAVSMVEMEARLREDTDGSYRDATMARLREHGLKLKVLLDKGVTPDEYPAMERVALALETAAASVERVWRRHHRTP